MAVGIESGEGLQDRGRQLEHERDESYLGKRKGEIFFYHRIYRRHHRLYHIVEKMGYADDDKYGIGCALHSLRAVTIAVCR